MQHNKSQTTLSKIGTALQRYFDFSEIPSGEYEKKYYPNGRKHSFSVDEETFVKKELHKALKLFKGLKQ